MKRRFAKTMMNGLACAALVMSPRLEAGTVALPAMVPALGWDASKQGGFPVSLAADKSGNVWVGTEGNGLWRYDAAGKTWSQFTTNDGLGDDCVYALAIDRQNRVWAGHLNHGVSVYNGQTWKNYGLLDGPLGDRVFSIAVSPKDGDVWIATDLGLARYSEARQDWDYYTRASGLPADQISSVVFDGAGKLYASTQCDGIVTAAPEDHYTKWHAVAVAQASERKPPPGQPNAVVEAPEAAAPASGSIRASLALPDHPPLFAGYDHAEGGLLTPASPNPPEWKPLASGTAAASPPPLPAPATPPTLEDAKPLEESLAKFNAQLDIGEAYYLADDWRTEGDWVGRYGGGYASLCGMTDGNEDYALAPGYEVSIGLGPNHAAGAKSPALHHDDDVSTELRSLYSPALGHRRDANVNDLSDDRAAYPVAFEGPDLWVHVTVPDGVHCLSLYFVNDDAHDANGNQRRDYQIQIVPGDVDAAKTQAPTPLARARVSDFWGGVYKQFLLCGPAKFVVKIGRNGSFGTRLQGIFLDRVTGQPPDNPGRLPGFDTVRYEMPDEPAGYPASGLATWASDMWNGLDQSIGVRGAIPLEMPMHIWCYRAAIAGEAPAALLERWRWEIGLWNADDRKKFDEAMKAAHDAAQ
jgi:hypothetical protein